ncbi:hypothetical protein BD410DRAFT_783548 [Rickenella mellea]|uniref:Uncharacterized protein n=1 Tax=Rickenella mellea TaxID=50990 RepID=A0A4Y7QH22_9AGAM|nr:hypothetical protein BD410DRAFT_783548 [Rickenella mellea]
MFLFPLLVHAGTPCSSFPPPLSNMYFLFSETLNSATKRSLVALSKLTASGDSGSPIRRLAPNVISGDPRCRCMHKLSRARTW